MSIAKREPRWPKRLAQIPSRVSSIRFPDQNDPLSQDAEWCEITVNGKEVRLRLHDYDKIYRIQGLYEKLFYERLECTSPTRVAHLLAEVLDEFDDPMEGLRVLDLGAGSGMVGDEFVALGVRTLVGVDIIPEAREAALRDRKGLYHDYVVADFTDLPEQVEERLREYQLNCLTTVAALGFGDIPSTAFIKALDLIDTPGWLAFNIKEDFLYDDDHTGFCELVHALKRQQIIRIEAMRRYQHRLSISGEPLYYVAVVARKLDEVPDNWFRG